MKNTIANANLKFRRTVIEDLPVDGDELSNEHLHRVAGGVLAKAASTSSGTVIVMKSYVPASCTRPPIPGFPSDTDDIQVDGPKD